MKLLPPSILSSLERTMAALAAIDTLPVHSTSSFEYLYYLRALMKGYKTAGLPLRTSTSIFRSRKLGYRPSHIEELFCPPASLTPFGRLNLPGNPVFYGSLHPTTSLLELSLRKGDIYIISHYELTKACVVQQVGYLNDGLLSVSGQRKIFWNSDPRFETEGNAYFRHWCGEHMKKRMPKLSSCFVSSKYNFEEQIRSSDKQHYSLTNAIGIMHMYSLGFASYAHQIDGLIYPSVASRLEGDNIAIKVAFAKSNLRLLEVRFRVVEKVDNGGFFTREYDSSRNYTFAGEIIWEGCPPKYEFGIKRPPYFDSLVYEGSEILPGFRERRFRRKAWRYK